MSILLACAIKPEINQVPFLLMGADSLAVNISKDSIVTRNENSDKIFKVNGNLFGIVGRFDTVFIESYIQFVTENNSEINTLTKMSFEYIKNFMINIDKFDDAKCEVYIGSCNNRTPKLATIRVKKSDINKASFKIQSPEVNQIIANFAGSIKVPEDDDLANNFFQRVGQGCINTNLNCVKKAAEDYLGKAASRYPQTCNQVIKLHVLR